MTGSERGKVPWGPKNLIFYSVGGHPGFEALPQTPKTSYFTVSGAPGPSGARLGASQAPQLAPKNLVFYNAWAARGPREAPTGAHRGPARSRRSPAGPAAGPRWAPQ